MDAFQRVSLDVWAVTDIEHKKKKLTDIGFLLGFFGFGFRSIELIDEQIKRLIERKAVIGGMLDCWAMDIRLNRDFLK